MNGSRVPANVSVLPRDMLTSHGMFSLLTSNNIVAAVVALIIGCRFCVENLGEVIDSSSGLVSWRYVSHP